MALTKVKDRYDCTDEMTEDKKNFIKMCARLEGDVRFLREDWKCDKHGDFYVLGLEGRAFPVAECADCKREEKIIEDSEEAIAKAYLPSSGLFRSQQKLMLDQFTGQKAAIAKKFLVKKEQLLMTVVRSTPTDTLLVCAMVGYVCRGGRQAQMVTMLQLSYRIQASWKGRKTTEDLLNEMIAYPFLVIDSMESGQEDWMKKFLNGLLTARLALKRKTVLLSEESSIRALIPEKVITKLNSANRVNLTDELTLNFSPTLEQMEAEGAIESPEDDNDGIPL